MPGAPFLLLYDTDDEGLARDLSHFLRVLGVEPTMILWAPSGGRTLKENQDYYFKNARVALFLITPGSIRHGNDYPSPSVVHEMGRASHPGIKGIYLAEEGCELPSVDQKVHIRFNREKMPSVIGALTRLITELHDAGMLAAATPDATTPAALRFSAKEGVYRRTGDDLAYCASCYDGGESRKVVPMSEVAGDNFWRCGVDNVKHCVRRPGRRVTHFPPDLS